MIIGKPIGIYGEASSHYRPHHNGGNPTFLGLYSRSCSLFDDPESAEKQNLDQYVANSIFFREYAECDDDAGVNQQEREKSLAIPTSGDCQEGREKGGELDGPDHVMIEAGVRSE